jgi:glucokinase
MKAALGVDIGGTKTAFGIVDEKGNILFQDILLTTSYETPEDLVRALQQKLLLHLEKIKEQYEFAGIGIGAPNANFFTGTVENAPNLKWKGVIRLAEIFKNAFGLNAVLTNDANAAAMGEMIFGGAKGMKDFLFITLGTGLGSGIVSGGNLIYGHDGFAGELGHTIIFPEGRLCGCGRRGCLETYCSATGLRRTYAEEKGEEFSKETASSKDIYERALMGEPEAVKSFEITTEILGLALANAVTFTSPKAIFIFGGLAQAGDYLLKPVKEHFEKNLMINYKNKIDIRPSQLKESDAAILGAASLVMN